MRLSFHQITIVGVQLEIILPSPGSSGPIALLHNTTIAGRPLEAGPSGEVVTGKYTISVYLQAEMQSMLMVYT